jgi:gas vesicle protein
VLDTAVFISHDSLFGMEIGEIISWCAILAVLIKVLKVVNKANRDHIIRHDVVDRTLALQDEQINKILGEVLKDHGTSLRDAVDHLTEEHKDFKKNVKDEFEVINKRFDYHLAGKKVTVTRHPLIKSTNFEEYGQGVD